MKIETSKDHIIFRPEDDKDCYELGVLSAQIKDSTTHFNRAEGGKYEMGLTQIKLQTLWHYLMNTYPTKYYEPPK